MSVTGLVAIAALLAAPTAALAQYLSYPLRLVNETGVGETIGSVSLTNTEYGLLIMPDLENLPAGVHGFHVHENADCGPAEKDGEIVPGLAAGGHYDPRDTGEHEGPYGEGHLGDLPPLYVEASGSAQVPVLAPRLALSDVLGRALIVHAGGDNFSDEPEPLGGGGTRLACGVISIRSHLISAAVRQQFFAPEGAALNNPLESQLPSSSSGS
ncbi:superoxide dismutase family protein [Romeria aff. gracilis LEGE 07310]|uniref:Superoxide dismutase [Cu-Zn] n=1 Tax=Vasconcelosia minhoensis LEGE 07310 TaxID=915328 RepID=A0A8J7DF38_9CYAN|nr:superoxide dismutase family protein [Romeria aff. gracilis LEGE 07310]